MSEIEITPPVVAQVARRMQAVAIKTLREHYPFKCCVICGLQLETALDAAHLDQNAGNNLPDNLAWLCKTHHWMYDAQLYTITVIKEMRARWQLTLGRPDHTARMKGAGARAAGTRKRSASARKAWKTRSAEDRTT